MLALVELTFFELRDVSWAWAHTYPPDACRNGVEIYTRLPPPTPPAPPSCNCIVYLCSEEALSPASPHRLPHFCASTIIPTRKDFPDHTALSLWAAGSAHASRKRRPLDTWSSNFFRGLDMDLTAVGLVHEMLQCDMLRVRGTSRKIKSLIATQPAP
ncbi:hypothetical protein K440DRAFT_216677 [Wilcoxina mikolae CBS 423.85]|nr:hypothetical protein K440DRAFT_216677 [Wilcoxina mikolae CBS 423.85]